MAAQASCSIVCCPLLRLQQRLPLEMMMMMMLLLPLLPPLYPNEVAQHKNANPFQMAVKNESVCMHLCVCVANLGLTMIK